MTSNGKSDPDNGNVKTVFAKFASVWTLRLRLARVLLYPTRARSLTGRRISARNVSTAGWSPGRLPRC